MEKPCVLKIAICEDVSADAAALEDCIKRSGVPSEYRKFDSGEVLLRSFCAGDYDVIFMDIYMKGMGGIETVRRIRKKDENTVIAFVTSSLYHTRESYKLNALKYIEKPVSDKSVRETLELAVMKFKTRPSIIVSTSGGIHEQIALDDIMYCESKNHVIEMHTTRNKIVTSQSVKLDKLEDRLPSPPFVRCHRSYIANLNYVWSCDRQENAFIMKDNARVDIRRGGLAKYRAELNEWRLSKVREK